MDTAQLLQLLRMPSDGREDALRLALELGIQCVDADEGSLLVLDEPTQELVFALTVGDEASARALRGQRVPVGSGLTGLAAMTGEVQVGTPSYTAVQQSAHRGSTAPRYLIAAPMYSRERLVGVLTAASFRHESQFSAAHVQLFGRIAALAGIVVAEGQLSQQLRQTVAEQALAASPLESLQREVANALQPFLADEKGARAVLAIVRQLSVLRERE